MTPAEFSDRTVVVTGGSQGIGAAAARAFAAAGANTVVHFRSRGDAAAALVAEINDTGGNAIAASGQLDVVAEVEQLFAVAQDAFGPVAILINNAGSFPNAPLIDMSIEQWRQMYADNVESAFSCSKLAAQSMRDTGGGAIVNIASIAAAIPGPEHAHYNSAKAALVMLTRSAAQEWGQYNIRVNAVSPGVVHAPDIMTNWPDGVKRFCEAAPLGCLVQPEDVANACLFLSSDRAARITGATLPVDSGVLSAPIY